MVILISCKGHHEVVRTLLQVGADVNAKDEVRIQMMIIVLRILMMIMMRAVHPRYNNNEEIKRLFAVMRLYDAVRTDYNE